MGLKTQCDADGKEDEERKGMFFGEHFPSLSIFKPVILERRTREVGHPEGADQVQGFERTFS